MLAAEPATELFVEHEEVELDLSLPCFTVEFVSELKDSLEQMGMAIAFKYPGADFLPLGSPEFYISQVIHKTMLEINEEGTVAAAATAFGVLFGAASIRPTQRKVLVFNRPFAILLLDTDTGAILFAGAIYDP